MRDLPASGNRMDGRVEQEAAAELGLVAWFLACDRLQARGERLFPLPGEGCDVAENPLQLFGTDIAWKWHRIETRTANSGVRQQIVCVVRSLRPALGQQFVLHDGDHESRVPYLLDGHCLDGGSDHQGCRQGATRS